MGRVPGWDNLEQLLATIVEAIDLGNRLFFMANTPKGSAVWEPIRIQRPGVDVEPRRRAATSAEMARFFGGGGSVDYTPSEPVNG